MAIQGRSVKAALQGWYKPQRLIDTDFKVRMTRKCFVEFLSVHYLLKKNKKINDLKRKKCWKFYVYAKGTEKKKGSNISSSLLTCPVVMLYIHRVLLHILFPLV